MTLQHLNAEEQSHSYLDFTIVYYQLWIYECRSRLQIHIHRHFAELYVEHTPIMNDTTSHSTGVLYRISALNAITLKNEK